MNLTALTMDANMVPFDRKIDGSVKRVRDFRRETKQSLRASSSSFSSFGRTANLALASTSRRLNTTSRQLSGFSTSAFRATRNLGLAVSGIGIVSAKMASDFRSQMGEVATLMDDVTDNQIKEMSLQVQQMRTDYAQTGETATKALFDITSAGFQGAEGMQVLETSSKLAVAGVSSVAQTSDLLTSALNAYDLQATQSTRVSDIFFATQKKGKTTISELAANLGNVLPTAKLANQGLETVGAAVATITVGGISTAETVTSINAALTGLIKPADDSQKAMNELAIRTQDSSGKMLPLVEILEQFRGLPPETIARIFPNVRALKGVSVLVDKIETLKENIEDISKSTGATEKGFATMASEASFQFKAIFQSFQVDLERLGFAILDSKAFQNLLTKTKSVADNIGIYFEQNHVTVTSFVNDSILFIEKMIKKSFNFMEAIALGAASIFDAVMPGLTAIGKLFLGLIKLFNGLPPEARDIGIIGLILGGKRVVTLLATIGFVFSKLEEMITGLKNKYKEEFGEMAEATKPVRDMMNEFFPASKKLTLKLETVEFSRDLDALSTKTNGYAQQLKQGFKDVRELAEGISNSSGGSRKAGALPAADKKSGPEVLEEISVRADPINPVLFPFPEGQLERGNASRDKALEEQSLVNTIFENQSEDSITSFGNFKNQKIREQSAVSLGLGADEGLVKQVEELSQRSLDEELIERRGPKNDFLNTNSHLTTIANPKKNTFDFKKFQAEQNNFIKLASERRDTSFAKFKNIQDEKSRIRTKTEKELFRLTDSAEEREEISQVLRLKAQTDTLNSYKEAARVTADEVLLMDDEQKDQIIFNANESLSNRRLALDGFVEVNRNANSSVTQGLAGVKAGFADLALKSGNTFDIMRGGMTSFTNTFSSSMGNAVTKGIQGVQTFEQGFKNVLSSVLNAVISTVTQITAQFLLIETISLLGASTGGIIPEGEDGIIAVQAGEAIVSRAGTKLLGEGFIHAINRGQPSLLGVTTPNFLQATGLPIDPNPFANVFRDPLTGSNNLVIGGPVNAQGPLTQTQQAFVDANAGANSFAGAAGTAVGSFLSSYIVGQFTNNKLVGAVSSIAAGIGGASAVGALGVGASGVSQFAAGLAGSGLAGVAIAAIAGGILATTRGNKRHQGELNFRNFINDLNRNDRILPNNGPSAFQKQLAYTSLRYPNEGTGSRQDALGRIVSIEHHGIDTATIVGLKELISEGYATKEDVLSRMTHDIAQYKPEIEAFEFPKPSKTPIPGFLDWVPTFATDLPVLDDKGQNIATGNDNILTEFFPHHTRFQIPEHQKPYLGSFEQGLGYVPYDGLANIHQGERILTAQENSRYSSNSSDNSSEGIKTEIQNQTREISALRSVLERIADSVDSQEDGKVILNDQVIAEFIRSSLLEMTRNGIEAISPNGIESLA